MKDTPFILSLSCLLGLMAFGCGGEEGRLTDEITVDRPESVTVIERSLVTRRVPTNWTTTLKVVHSNTGTLLGNASGLFALTPTSVTRMDAGPVADMVEYLDLILVARADGVFIWGSGLLTRSPLSDLLGGGTVTGLTVRGDALWISTTTGLFAYADGQLASLMESMDVRAVHGGLNASYLTTSVGDNGTMVALEPQVDAWQVLDFTGSDVAAVRPGSQSLYGLFEGKLFHYQSADDHAVWRAMALTSEGEPQGGILGISTSDGGQLWGLTSDSIFQYDSAILSTFRREDTLSIDELVVDAAGNAWLTDGATLATYFETPPVTIDASWGGSIAAFAEANCTRCHGVLGTAHGLHTQEQWATEIDNIIRVLEDGSMPADGQTLSLGDVELLRAWKDGGLR